MYAFFELQTKQVSQLVSLHINERCLLAVGKRYHLFRLRKESVIASYASGYNVIFTSLRTSTVFLLQRKSQR